jgi:tartrate-resistant acid phosphatase type 5
MKCVSVCFFVCALIVITTGESSNFISFQAIGDSGDITQGLAITAGAVLSDDKPRFRLLLGDNFYENGVNGLDDPLWQSTFELPFPDDGVEYLPVLGNHDHHGDFSAQILYSLNHSLWAMPHSYYYRLFLPHLCIVCIDTEDLFQINQLRWLDAVLSSRACSGAAFRVVAGHHPVYSAGEHGDTPNLITSVLPILQRWAVDLYICGHDHDLQHLSDGAITFVVSGAASRIRASPANPGHPHLRWVRGGALGFARHAVNASHLTTAFIDSASRAVIHSFAIPRARLLPAPSPIAAPAMPDPVAAPAAEQASPSVPVVVAAADSNPLLPAGSLSAAVSAGASEGDGGGGLVLLEVLLAAVAGGVVGFVIARRRAAAAAAAAEAGGDESSVRLTSAAAQQA